MPELKTCPWCQGEAKLIKHIPISPDYFYISCTNNKCGVQPYSKTVKSKEKVREAWNTRKEEEDERY